MIIFIIGHPGSGKGTQSLLLSNKMHLPHISAGEIYRESARKGTALGLKAKKYWEKGKLAPDDLTIKLVNERVSKKDCKKGFILDGSPRTIRQAKILYKKLKVDYVFELAVNDRMAIRRLSVRKECSKCDSVYNIKKLRNKNVCVKCRGKLYQREDDRPKAIRRRFRIYHKTTKPVLSFYRRKKILHTIDASKSVGAVFKE